MTVTPSGADEPGHAVTRSAGAASDGDRAVSPDAPALRPDAPALRPDAAAVSPGNRAGSPDAPAASPGDPTDVDLLASALRADTSDLDVYARVLTQSLSEALPAGMVTVDRDRSLGDRLAGRAGVVTGVHIALGDWQLDLAREHGAMQARCAQRVRGVVISSKPVTVDEWVRLLAARLAEQARASESARAALQALVSGRPLS